MEMYFIKQEPESLEIIDNIDNNGNYVYNCSQNYFEINQESYGSIEDNPRDNIGNSTYEMDNVFIKQELSLPEEIEDIINTENYYYWIDHKPTHLELNNNVYENSSTSIFSEMNEDTDFPVTGINDSLDKLLPTLRSVSVVLERLSMVQILNYTMKSDPQLSDHARLNVEAMKYICVFFCLKCDSTIDIKRIQGIKNCPDCGYEASFKYQCMKCNKFYASHARIRDHLKIKGMCKSGEQFLNFDEFNKQYMSLSCPKCNKAFESANQFIEHVNNCKEDPKFWCPLCNFGAMCKETIEGHMQLHASEKSYLLESFYAADEQTKIKLNRKIIVPARKIIYYCSTCDEILNKHGLNLSESHCNTCKSSVTYLCPTCKIKKFLNLASLRKHMSYCGKPSLVRCRFCDYKTKFNASLQKHMETCKKNPGLVSNVINNGGQDVAILPDYKQIMTKNNLLYDLFCEKCNEPKETGECKLDYIFCLTCWTKLLLRCLRCNRIYKSCPWFSSHIISDCGFKSYNKLQECYKCNRKFKKINVHLQFCRDLTKYCAHCTYSTTRKGHLTRHISRHKEEIFNTLIREPFIDQRMFSKIFDSLFLGDGLGIRSILTGTMAFMIFFCKNIIKRLLVFNFPARKAS